MVFEARMKLALVVTLESGDEDREDEAPGVDNLASR